MAIVITPRLPSEVLDFYASSPFENFRFLVDASRPFASQFHYDASAPERGAMLLYSHPAPGVSPVATFTDGDPQFLMELAQRVPSGAKHWWIIPSPHFYALIGPSLDGEADENLVFVREDRTQLDPGMARELTEPDIPVLQADRPHSAGIIGKHGIRVFGVIADGVWRADAWAIPLFGEYMTVGSVYTRQDSLRLGYGRQAVSACTNHILAAGKVPVYETARSNVPSQRLAVACGYRQRASQIELEATRRD